MHVDTFVSTAVKGLQEKLESANKVLLTGIGISNMEDYKAALAKVLTYQECLNHLEHVYSQFYHTTTFVFRE